MKTFSKILILLLCCTVSHVSFAQINANTNTNATDLAQRLTGFGVTVSNAVLNCPPLASADFEVVASNLGLDSGIALTTGTAVTTGVNQGINGPASGPSANNQVAGDADLTLLCNKPTFDACILDFDFITIGDTVKFNYVFGSSEYPSFTCSNFNDVFGFFISGPGIAGPYSNGAKNIALVPGSTTCPVGVSTIYCPNNPGCCNTTNTNCYNLTPGCGAFNAVNNTCAYFVCNAGGASVNYQGFTTVLQAVSEVVPCSTYHMKLAISDASDGILDSGVFLEAGSFSSNVVDIKLNTGLATANGDPYIIEGCDTAIIDLKRKVVLGSVGADTINFLIQGTAQNGIDYNQFQDTLIFTNNIADTVRSISLYAFNDNLAEGTEFIKIYVQSGCSQTITDSLIIEIRDSISFDLVTGDTSICFGDTVLMAGSSDPGIDINWSPTADVANPNQINTIITPSTIGTQAYTVTGTYRSCSPTSRTVVVNTDPNPIITPLPDIDICENEQVQINAQVAPPFAYNINWVSTSGLTNTAGYNPTFNGTVTQDIVLNITSPNAACAATDTFTANVWPYAVGDMIDDTITCSGDPLELWATSSTGQFLWSPSALLSCSTCSNPITSTFGAQVYQVILVEDHGCNDTLSSIIDIQTPFNLVLHNNDTTIYYGDEVQLNASGAYFYIWEPNRFLSFSAVNNPVASPKEDITYVVTGLGLYKGCPQYDSVRIKVIIQDVFVPNAFSPNGDGLNDIIKIWARKNINAQEFRIYNRWGQQVFYTNDISRGWDGRFNGVEQGAGTYYYLIRVAYPDGRAQMLKGDITLLR